MMRANLILGVTLLQLPEEEHMASASFTLVRSVLQGEYSVYRWVMYKSELEF